MNTALNVQSPATVANTMKLVLAALIPGMLVFIYQTGWGGIFNLLLAVTSALGFEALAQKLRRRPASVALGDFSAVVTGVLIALCLPPLVAWWVPVLATGFAILLAKHAFGGLGHNLFNPAMIGYAVVLISFPADLSLWLLPAESFSVSLNESIRAVLTGGVSTVSQWDALTGATALDSHRSLLIQGASAQTVSAETAGWFGARHSEWINLAYLCGGAWLYYKKTINWHIPVSFLGALLIALLLHNIIDQAPMLPAVQLFGGATMLCAFFISTDPVSAAASNRGRILYGALTGALVYVIRAYGAYPDSIAFAVLLANCTVPAIDRLDIWLRRPTNER